MDSELTPLRTVVAAHDEEIRQLRELHDLHTQMIDALHEASQACVTALSELLAISRAGR